MSTREPIAWMLVLCAAATLGWFWSDRDDSYALVGLFFLAAVWPAAVWPVFWAFLFGVNVRSRVQPGKGATRG